MSKLHIGEIFTYQRPYDFQPQKIGAYRNHFFATATNGLPLCLLESGINPIGEIKANSQKRRPAILIRSNPHKTGTLDTPWQDIFDLDNGHIRYYGDNKTPGADPASTKGNKVLIEAFKNYYSDDGSRFHSVPLIFYKTVIRNNKAKGFIEFNGFGIIKQVELVTQYDRKLDRTFSNFAYNFEIFKTEQEHEAFDWHWISSRRNENHSTEDALKLAPASWKEWIHTGKKSLERIRRSVSKLNISNTKDQLPESKSQEEKILLAVYKSYENNKLGFEGVAATVTAKLIGDDIGKYKEGWITPAGSDNGVDFYGRIDIGTGFGTTKLIVLGQAKCEQPHTPTNGNHIARTVARLRRGYIGVYVTTSHFSEKVQREIIEDEYPILLINGRRLAQILIKIMHDDGHKDLESLLLEINSKYESRIQNRRARELFLE